MPERILTESIKEMKRHGVPDDRAHFIAAEIFTAGRLAASTKERAPETLVAMEVELARANQASKPCLYVVAKDEGWKDEEGGC